MNIINKIIPSIMMITMFAGHISAMERDSIGQEKGLSSQESDQTVAFPNQNNVQSAPLSSQNQKSIQELQDEANSVAAELRLWYELNSLQNRTEQRDVLFKLMNRL